MVEYSPSKRATRVRFPANAFCPEIVIIISLLLFCWTFYLILLAGVAHLNNVTEIKWFNENTVLYCSMNNHRESKADWGIGESTRFTLNPHSWIHFLALGHLNWTKCVLAAFEFCDEKLVDSELSLAYRKRDRWCLVGRTLDQAYCDADESACRIIKSLTWISATDLPYNGNSVGARSMGKDKSGLVDKSTMSDPKEGSRSREQK